MTRTARSEFSNRVRAAAYLRSGERCEECGASVKHKTWHCDHITPCMEGGEATLDNARILCVPCHAPKSAAETGRAAKADRLARKHMGARPKRAVIPGSKASKWKVKIGGGAVRREE